MPYRTFMRAAKVLAISSLASVTVTVVLGVVSVKTIDGHPYPDEPGMEAALILALFGSISFCLVLATIVFYWIGRTEAREHTDS